MFRPHPPQRSLFGMETMLSKKMWQRLEGSWAAVFRREVFERIDEQIFAPLYSKTPSRPNAPVNVLVGFEILKAGLGVGDEEMYDLLCFDLRVRYALGIDDIATPPPFELRTVRNFRRRVREYEQRHGENLWAQVFAQITDEQLQTFGLQVGKQRFDSTQVLSCIADRERLELLIAVLQRVWRAVPERERERWAEQVAPYVGKRPHEIVYRIPPDEKAGHMQAIGELLVSLREVVPEGSEARTLLERVLAEQYAWEGEEVRVRPAAEVPADSVQSPDDMEATYREKGGKAYHGGYVVQVAETCEAEQPSMIVDVQVEPNVTDDGTLLQASIEAQERRGHRVEVATVDGGYTGPETEAFCEAHGVTLQPTNVRGGKCQGEQMDWTEYEWEVDKHGRLVRVRCPEGQEGRVIAGQNDHWRIRFDTERCMSCPLLSRCRVQIGPRVGATLYVRGRSVRVALLRQGMRPEHRALRAPVENTMKGMKHRLPGGKVPVRGLHAVRRYMYGRALMLNVRRLHAYLTTSCPSLCLWLQRPVHHALFSLVSAFRQAISVCQYHVARLFTRCSPTSCPT